MSITFTQRFHPVGQGLFYSCSLSNNNNQANIVFDCGSDKIDSVNREVTAYKKEVQEIDLLILSHLHYDHVSGLDELLNGTTVKTVVLPYLNKFERILLQIDNGSVSQWYSSFLDNPYNWLSEKNIEKIVVFNGNGEQSNDNIEEINLPDFDSYNNFEINMQLSVVSDTEKSKIEQDENIQPNQKVSIYHASGYIQIANLYFKFFNYQIDATKLTNFKSALNKLGITNTQSALAILKDSKQRKGLEEAYKQIEKYDLNKTSLVAYQGLIFQKNKDRIYFDMTRNCISNPILLSMCCCDDCDCHGFIDWNFHRYILKNRYRYDCYCYCDNHIYCKNMLGTLLLGDIKLDYKKTTRKDELFKYYAKLLKTVQLVQLSHHGAENGWNDKLIDEISPSCLYIASHGLQNKYAHPHKDVLIKLAINQRRYISVTEYNEYYSSFEIKF